MAESFEGDMGAERADEESLVHRRLEERAIRERWPIPESVRMQILQRLVDVIDPENPEKPKLRYVLGAAKTILAADKLNIEARKLDIVERKLEGTDSADLESLLIDGESSLERRSNPETAGSAAHPREG